MRDKILRRDFLKILPVAGAGTIAVGHGASAAPAGSLKCDLSGYKPAPGLTAAASNNVLTITWDGEKNQELRMRMAINDGTPTIQDLALRRPGADWTILLSNATPDFRFVSGYRRMDNQQMAPLKELGIAITPEIIAKDKWHAFWDAPLMVPGTEKGGNEGSRPPAESVGGQPGLPRKPEEINRGTADYRASSCTVKTNGNRLEIIFPGDKTSPGVKMGTVFSGYLQYTVYRGTNLIRQEVIAETEMPSVAYKYDAGLKGLTIQPASHIVWRDPDYQWQDYAFGGPVDVGPVTVQSANRLAAAEISGGAIAAFPPPHNFFWQSELELNLGSNWYRKDGDTFAFGIRQAESQASNFNAGRGPSDTRENWALRDARPGTWQRMPVYFHASLQPGRDAIQAALAFTREDTFKPLPGRQVMATHYHTNMVSRLQELGGLNVGLPDFSVAKAAGINIWAPIDGGRDGRVGSNTSDERGQRLALYYEAAKLHSDKDFIIMANEEIAFGRFNGLDVKLGGHNDLLVSHPVYWDAIRAPGQPLVEDDPKYGKVYHCGSPADLMEMARLEDLLLYMPHPRAKGSTGFPDAIKDKAHFRHANWRGIGFRWGLGVDGSEKRLSDYRCQPVFDDMNNWVADLPTPPKYVHAISEFEAIGYGDDFYANNPVDYVRLDVLPGPGDWHSIIDALKRGDYFTTSGEVLIPSYAVEGTGSQRNIVADVEWTFPLEFVEVVWGDGKKTDRKIIPATDMPAFGKHRFQIPFNATGKKWVRFAVWDSAGNGAMVQPIKLV